MPDKIHTVFRYLLLLCILPPFCSAMCLPQPPEAGEDLPDASLVPSQDQSFGVTSDVGSGGDPIGETSEMAVGGGGGGAGSDLIGETSEVGGMGGARGDPIGETLEVGVAVWRDTIGGDTMERRAKRETEEGETETGLSVGDMIMKSYKG